MEKFATCSKNVCRGSLKAKRNTKQLNKRGEEERSVEEIRGKIKEGKDRARERVRENK